MLAPHPVTLPAAPVREAPGQDSLDRRAGIPTVISVDRIIGPPVTWHPDIAMALLRIGVGAYLGKAVLTKLTVVWLGGLVPWPVVSPRWMAVMPHLVARQAAGNPLMWYRDFLTGTVLHHGTLFAQLTAWGEAVSGTLLVLGLLTGVGSALGIWLVANYALATQWMSPSQQVMHALLLLILLLCWVTRAGRRWGVDALMASRGGWLSHRPFS